MIGDRAAETRVARAVHLAHVAGADPVEDLVVAECLEHGTRDDYTDALNSYVSILRNNRNFRLLYIGQTISQLGDWFNAVAVFALLLDLTGSATAVAWMMIVQFLPVAIVGPLAGVVVDRVNRRRLMIGTDLLRGVLILGLLLVRRPDQVWIAYVVMAVAVGAQAFFEPARTATIPNITSAGGADAGQRAVERDVVGDAGARRVDRRPGDGAGRAQRRVRRQRAVVLRVGLFHRPDAVRRDAGRRAAAQRVPRADRHHRS